MWKFPLPSFSTLYCWASKIIVEPDILESVVNLLKYKGQSMTEIERICVISFDECSFKSVELR